MTSAAVGIVALRGTIRNLAARRHLVDAATGGAADHISLTDHVSFHGGAGSDGLIDAASLLSLSDDVEVHTAIYLLPLRHPVLVARQLSNIAEIAPGRLVFGVGIGGEHRHEVEICGVDPATRGRRMDESLEALESLLSGKPASFSGRFFDFQDTLIAPAPTPPIPIRIGGRSTAAVSRVARFGDGWIGIWVSPKRFASVVEEVAALAVESGRTDADFHHGLFVWCGFDSDQARARSFVAEAMESTYRVPFDSFERYSPYGTPEGVAEQLRPYIEAGCSTFHLVPCADSVDAAIAGAAEVRRLLR